MDELTISWAKAVSGFLRTRGEKVLCLVVVFMPTCSPVREPFLPLLGKKGGRTCLFSPAMPAPAIDH